MNTSLWFPGQPVTGSLIADPPDPLRGYADHPLVRAWERKAQAGEPVTFAERNALVASLAWSADVFARPPRYREAVSLFVPTGPGVTLALGAVPFLGGDVRAPLPGAPTAPAGSAIQAPAATQGVVTAAERLARWQTVHAILFKLALRPAQLVLVPAPPGAAPAGNPMLIGVGVGLAVTVVAVVGVGSYAAYAAYTEGVRIESAARTQQVRYAEEQMTARTAVREKAKLDAAAQRFAAMRVSGQWIPPTPQETADTPVEPHPAMTGEPSATDWRKELTATIDKAVTLGVVGVIGLGGASILANHYLPAPPRPA